VAARLLEVERRARAVPGGMRPSAKEGARLAGRAAPVRQRTSAAPVAT